MKQMQHLYIALLFGFLLGIRGGFIALWEDGKNEPVEVFPYKAHYLPAADRQALERGIHVESTDDLARLLEDYLS